MIYKVNQRQKFFSIGALALGALLFLAFSAGGCRGQAPEGAPGAEGQGPAAVVGAGAGENQAAPGGEAQPSGTANPAEFKNNPPEITSISLGYDPVEKGGGIRAQVEARDPEGARFEMKYRWIRNLKEEIESHENPLPRKYFSRGDILQVEVTASDGELTSPPRTSTQFGVANSAPVIVSTASTTFPKGLYTYEVKAQDPDEDKLTYALRTAPSGMKIDPGTGVINWTPTEGGKYDVEVAVTDIMGLEGTQKFTLEVVEVERKPAPAAPATP